MGNYTIEHERPGCIGCAACAAIAPQFWKMDDKDGKSDVIGGKRLADGTETRDIEESDLALNREAAASCPVNVIHLRDKEKGERIL